MALLPENEWFRGYGHNIEPEYGAGDLIETTPERPRPHTMTTYPQPNEQYSVVVDKRTHRIRYEGETESGVVVVFEPKD